MKKLLSCVLITAIGVAIIGCESTSISNSVSSEVRYDENTISSTIDNYENSTIKFSYGNQLDFSEKLGFKITQSSFGETMPVETFIIDNSIAELKYELDRTNTLYLQIGKANNVPNIYTKFKNADFEIDEEKILNDIKVHIRYSVGGPAFATWTQNNYQFFI